MPYPNEHACRLVNPETLTIIGSGVRTAEGGKKYRVIFGRKKDGSSGTVEQGFRYSKDV